ncbi:MAG: tetratricopeptide repeat protein, partial [Acidobacteriota bacterium]
MKTGNVLLLLAFLSFSHVSGQESDLAVSYYHFSQAKMHEFNAEYPEAISEFEKAISFDSRSARLRVEFARALLKTGNVNRAVQQCQTAIELDPADGAPRFLLGQIYSNLSDEAEENVEQAILEFERTVELDPEHFEALFYLGQFQLERKNYQSAVSSLSQFLQLRPWVARAYLLKSRAHRGLSDLEAAVETLERSREYDEANLEVVRELGQLYEDAKEYEKASGLYGEFLAVAENFDIEFRQALVLSQQERLVEAVSILRRLSDNAPDNLRLKVFLGEVLKKRKSYAEAAEIFRQVLEVEPNNFTANFRLGESLAQLGERQQAIERFLRLLEINGSDQDRVLIQTSLAFVYQDARQFDKSADLFQTIIRENPEDDLARLRLAYLFKESGQLEEALALSDELLSKCWDSSYEKNSLKKYYV